VLIHVVFVFEDTNPLRGSGDNMWYSFDVGPVHFVSFSTETDYPGAPVDVKRKKRSISQLAWIDNDLANVNRTATPFVIVIAHRPIYVNKIVRIVLLDKKKKKNEIG
jgi:hypothetical protein